MSLYKDRSFRNAVAIFHDGFMAAVSFLLALYIRLGDELIDTAYPYLPSGTAVFTLICLVIFSYMRLYRGSWRYAGVRDLITIVRSVTLAILLFALFLFLFNRESSFPRSVLFINWMLLLALLGGPRFIYRAMKDHTLDWKLSAGEATKIPVLLIGAGDSAEQFIRDSQRDSSSPYDVVGLIDDNPAQKGRTIHRVNIYGNSELVPVVVKKLTRKGIRPQKIIVSDDNVSGAVIGRLLDMADTLGIPLARLPSLNELKQGIAKKIDVRPVAVEDLLGRSQNVLDRRSMREFVEGRRVLITGAGGTIGGELARQIASYNPSTLVIIEACEFNFYQIERELLRIFPHLSLNGVLGDVRDEGHIENIFAKYQPELVFHAAAIKHVPIAEYNIEETILTNVFGTCNIAEACIKYHAQAMVMISTDKAVNPTNVMGASKRLAESFCQALGKQELENKNIGNTKFITVRFGNVLGSAGSVVPLFTEQLARGGPITVTDPEMTRYFMTVREAVELVLQASVLGQNMQEKQEYIFVLDMGKPMKILDLALQMIKLAGFRPYTDIDIVFTGLRPGEKLYEELFHLSENAVKTSHQGIFLASPRQSDLKTLKDALASLREVCKSRKTGQALELLRKLVPEFTPRNIIS